MTFVTGDVVNAGQRFSPVSSSVAIAGQTVNNVPMPLGAYQVVRISDLNWHATLQEVLRQ
jgi:hypothetical protein